MVHSKKEPRNTDYRAYFEGKRLSYFTSKFMVTILCHLFKLALAGSGDFGCMYMYPLRCHNCMYKLIFHISEIVLAPTILDMGRSTVSDTLYTCKS